MTGDITVTELKQRLDAGENINIVDVREPWEFEEFNINGKLIPLGELQGKIDDLDAWTEEEVVVHCKSGGRSAAAVDFMTRQGFKNARNLAGGMLAWQAQTGA
ncbi:MAG: rhodanese-like domain-containing protein [Bacteroidetes bacterium]|jgi:rhodanese-related sulfurtransferase|nr:rhodanese-like domain-containing protein [Bacteroidota bacterium]